MRPWRWRESIRESSVRTSTRFRYPVRRRSGESFGSNFESYVPSTSTMRRRLSSVVLSPPPIRVAPDHLLGEELAGPVGRAHEGPGGHVGEAHRLSGLADDVAVSREFGAAGLGEHVGPAGLDLPHGPREMRRAAVGEVVSIDRRQDDVSEVHLGQGDRDLPRFVEIQDPMRVPRSDRAEAAASRAHVAHQHDRRGPAAPTFPHVRAVGLLAHGVEVQGSEETFQLRICLAGRRPYPEPLWLPFGEHRRVDKAEAAYLANPNARLVKGASARPRRDADERAQPNRNSTPYDPRG